MEINKLEDDEVCIKIEIIKNGEKLHTDVVLKKKYFRSIEVYTMVMEGLYKKTLRAIK